MRKFTFILALLIVLSGCAQTAAPVDVPSVQSSPQEVSSAPAPSSGSSDGENATASSQPPDTAVQDMPKPEELPAATAGAITLPETLYTSPAGYTLELLTPAQYQMEVPMNRGGPRGFFDTQIFRGTQGDRYALFNANGKQITESIYQPNDDGWVVENGVAFVTDAATGNEGAVNAADGSVILPAEYDRVWFVPDTQYLLATKNDTTQVIDSNGGVLYTLGRGDHISLLGSDVDMVTQDGTIKLFHHSDKTPIKNLACEESMIVSEEDDKNSNGMNLVAVKVNGKWGLIDDKGEFVVEPVYEQLGRSFRGDYIEFHKNGKMGVIDYQGKVAIKPDWDELVLYHGSASVRKGQKWGAITDLDSGKLAIDTVYDYLEGFGKGGYACFERGGKFGLIDRDGNEIVNAKYGRITTDNDNFDEDVFLVEGEDMMTNGVMVGGKLVIPVDHTVISRGINAYYDADEPYNLVGTPSGKWGYIDSRGQYVIDAMFDNADGFIRGRDIAMVSKNGKICLIDRKGNTVLETVFDDCGGFNPETMVCSMRYTDENGESRYCLVKINAA